MVVMRRGVIEKVVASVENHLDGAEATKPRGPSFRLAEGQRKVKNQKAGCALVKVKG